MDYEESLIRGDESYVVRENKGEILTENQEDELISASDPSRPPPHIFLKVTSCIAAIEKEMTDLATRNSSGIPSLAPIRLGDIRYKALPLTHTTMIARRKNLAIFKARLCIRGEEIHHIGEFDTSAPKAARISPRIPIVISMIFQWKLGILDVGHAFLQADLIASNDRVRLILPHYLSSRWKGSVNLDADRLHKPHWGYIAMRPLYGTKCAPAAPVPPHLKRIRPHGLETSPNGSMRVPMGISRGLPLSW